MSRTLAAGAALALFLLAGCGDSDAGGTDASSSSSPAPAEPTDVTPAAESAALEVTSVDFGFELDDDDLTAGTYEVTLTNDGSSTHNLVVERDGEDVAGSEDVDPGESTTFTVTLDEGGYVFYCSIANHRAMGMEVDVEVGA
jgi:plastocyanin